MDFFLRVDLSIAVRRRVLIGYWVLGIGSCISRKTIDYYSIIVRSCATPVSEHKVEADHIMIV